jgi:hypothetical protein
MGRRHRTYPDEHNDNKEKALRKKVKEQEAEIKRLKSELKTLNAAFSKTAGFIKGNLENVTIEKIIQGVSKEKPMVSIKKENSCPDCGAELKSNRLPFGQISICTAACGYRSVVNDKEE